jgi:hypothetical protein
MLANFELILNGLILELWELTVAFIDAESERTCNLVAMTIWLTFMRDVLSFTESYWPDLAVRFTFALVSHE